ncbi:diiron oxygenase [Streptomyces sp. NBC_01298]|uniref:diiron oxygenase n=1 Tax=unclassified Streptomyces TaxID=2593676 RepID=UPI002250495B|nr:MULTISPECIES: diiron oxygenase [unclassified Streptomyces]MCX5404027.1 diiron oxygenase [Streptomyces sp. NBC_00086]WSK19853.1 diiron oxygenase [Streptomyces sp. NBC_01298]
MGIAAPLPVTDRFLEVLERLSSRSIEEYYNPYQQFDWPEKLEEGQLWMTPELLTVYGTPFYEELGEETIHRLSKWESINFYSLNVHGIRELLIEVVGRIHMPGFEVPSDFFHHFIGEENEHMWFFAEFCRRYGDKIYGSTAMRADSAWEPEVDNFLVFARILFFEELVDHYNMRMAQDESLCHTIREVNRIHHQDESRHIAFGRELVSLLFKRMKDTVSAQRLAEVEAYLKRYVVYSVNSLYNPHVYRDAGIADPLALRNALVADEGRRPYERKAIRKPLGFFLKTGIFTDDVLPVV